MTCRIKKKLADYQVGALDKKQHAEVQAHLQTCEACRRELAALDRTVALLRTMSQADAPREVWAGVAEQLTPRQGGRRVPAFAAAGAGKRAARGGRASAPQWRHWAPAFAAAMLILIVAVAVLLPLMHSHVVGPQIQDVYADLQVPASWHNTLADRPALGLALLATADRDPVQELQEAQEAVD